MWSCLYVTGVNRHSHLAFSFNEHVLATVPQLLANPLMRTTPLANTAEIQSKPQGVRGEFFVDQLSVDSSISRRIGGRYAVSLAPWIWSIPVFVVIIPLASTPSWNDKNLLIEMMGYHTMAWCGFGAILFTAHKTVLSHRTEHPVPLVIILIVGAIAGLVRSLMLGDWFDFLSLNGDHNLNKVINAAITGGAWIVISSLIVSGGHLFSDQFNILTKQQSDLLINSEEWLNQVRNQREQIISALRPELDQRWNSIRNKIHSLTNASGQAWEQVARDISMSSRETVHTMASSLRSPHKNKFQTRGPLREAFYLITHTPIIDSIRPSLILILMGTLPLTRFLGLQSGLIVSFNAAVLTFAMQEIGKRVIKRWPTYSSFSYTTVVAIASSFSFLLIPSLVDKGMSRSAAIGFALLGVTMIASSILIFSYLALTRNRRDETLLSLQRQNAILRSLNEANSKQSFEAAIDISQYLQTSVSKAIGDAQDMINRGIAQQDLQATQAGVAVIETIYSNIFGKYSEFEDLDLSQEISEIVKQNRDSLLTTFENEKFEAPREVTRRIIVLINELVTESISQKALRAHIKIQREESLINFRFEVNLPSTWVSNSPITTDVLNTATRQNWSIESTSLGSIVSGLILSPQSSGND